MWLEDDGARVRALPAHRLRGFDFGKAAPGAVRPAVYFYGWFDNVQGLYASFDWFESDPVLIGRFPGGSIDYVGASGPCRFTDIGDVAEASFRYEQVRNGKPVLLKIA